MNCAPPTARGLKQPEQRPSRPSGSGKARATSSGPHERRLPDHPVTWSNPWSDTWRDRHDQSMSSYMCPFSIGFSTCTPWGFPINTRMFILRGNFEPFVNLRAVRPRGLILNPSWTCIYTFRPKYKHTFC